MSYGRLYKLDLGPAIFFFPLQDIKICRFQNLDYWWQRWIERPIYGLPKQSPVFQLYFIREALHMGDYQVLAHPSVVCSLVSLLDIDPYINSLHWQNSDTKVPPHSQ